MTTREAPTVGGRDRHRPVSPAAIPPDEGRRGHRQLVWWADSEPSIRRIRAGRGFRYLLPDGRPAGAIAIARVRRLAIPPAWREVRICPHPAGYLQATGRDTRGRKQYRYHPDWRARREEAKFLHLVEFGKALPSIRDRVECDLGCPGMPRAKVLALVVRLLDVTHARVGSERYVRQNRSFGLTTLTNRHAIVDGSTVRLRFRGKAGRVHELGLRDRRLARLVRRCRELPGRDLFEYVADDGTVGIIRSEDVNDYLRAAAGAEVTAKMFRTWAATVIACRILRDAGPPASAGRASRHALRAAAEVVADRLGNTPAVARTSYIHPAVPEAYVLGMLEPLGEVNDEGAASGEAGPDMRPLTEADELAALEVIERWARERGGRPEKRTRPRG